MGEDEAKRKEENGTSHLLSCPVTFDCHNEFDFDLKVLGPNNIPIQAKHFIHCLVCYVLR